MDGFYDIIRCIKLAQKKYMDVLDHSYKDISGNHQYAINFHPSITKIRNLPKQNLSQAPIFTMVEVGKTNNSS